MKIKHFFEVVLLALTILSAVSCSKDDGGGDPVGTVSLNMLNEENGKTLLGNSDVYIDKANNFYGRSCLISSLGKKGRLVNLPPVLQGMSEKAAVEPGDAYQVFRNAALREFPSGKMAVNIAGDYYNVYVVSQITQNDQVIGANVRYMLANVPANGLPEYESTLEPLTYNNQEVEIVLPTADFEFEADSGNWSEISFEKVGKKLIVTLTEYHQRDYIDIYIRIGDSYTYVKGTVE